jgi:hypothetical protein
MRFFGRVFKDGKFWLAEIPILDLMTQGHTRDEAYKMAADIIETLVDDRHFKVVIHKGAGDIFEAEANDVRQMIALLLRRRREASGLTLAEVATKLGVKSRNAYARYEQGVSIPTLEKLNELLSVVSGGRDFVIGRSTAA